MKRHLSQHPDFPGVFKPIKEILFPPPNQRRNPLWVDIFINLLLAPVWAFLLFVLPFLMPLFVVQEFLLLCLDERGCPFTEPVLFVHDGTVYRAVNRLHWRLVTALDRAGRSHVLPLKQCFLPEASHLPQLEAWDAHITAGV